MNTLSRIQKLAESLMDDAVYDIIEGQQNQLKHVDKLLFPSFEEIEKALDIVSSLKKSLSNFIRATQNNLLDDAQRDNHDRLKELHKKLELLEDSITDILLAYASGAVFTIIEDAKSIIKQIK
jgi:hypothetical protein